MPRILVIKLGALGDFVHAFHAFAAIRAHHAADRVSLLTTAPFRALARAAPWFDEVRIDERAPWWNLRALGRTARQLRGFDFVYDLQTSGRSNRYFRLAGRPPWSGIAPGCSHPHANPQRDSMHTIERQREQLAMAGITRFPAPARAWLTGSGDCYGLASDFALLMPGSGGNAGRKRWPVAGYGVLAAELARRAITPVVIGGRAEGELAAVIRAHCPSAVDLTGRTAIADIAALAVRAALVVGNDTGPAQLAASVGAPTLVLFSRVGVLAQVAPRGPGGEWCAVLQEPDLSRLSADRVIAEAARLLADRPAP